MNPTSGVLTEAWEYYKAHWKHLLTIALIVYAAVAMLSVILTALLDVVGAILAAAVSIVGLFLLQGALVTAVADIRDSRADLSVEDTFRKAQPFLGRIAGASILSGIVLETILLFLPDELSAFISDVVSGTVTAPFITLTWTLLYFRMLAAKEQATGASGGPLPQSPPPVAPPPQQPPPSSPPPPDRP